MQKVSTHPAARHKTRTFTNSLVRYLMLSLCPGEGSAWTGAKGKSAIPQPKPIKAFSFCDPAKKVSLCSTRTQKLADNLQPGKRRCYQFSRCWNNSKKANASEDTQDRPTTTGHCCGGQCTSSAGGGWTYSGVRLWALWCCPDAGGPKQTPRPHGPLHVM
jgi:hypothetical protein